MRRLIKSEITRALRREKKLEKIFVTSNEMLHLLKIIIK